MPVEFSRRNVAKSTAWAIPAVAVAASAPAVASSTPTSTAVVGSAVCNLFYGSGTATAQTHYIYFQLSSSTGTIPAGSVIKNQVCVTNGTAQVPTTTYPANSDFTLTVQDSSGNTLTPGSSLPSGGCFYAVFTFNNAVDPASYGCTNAIAWGNGDQNIPGGASVTVTQNASVTGASSAGSGTVSYTVAQRYPTSINTTGRIPTSFTGISGSVTCYPSVTSSQASMTNDGADDVVCYPSGTNITTARCTWNGRLCTASSTGLCTPPYKSPVSGSTTIPSMC